MQRRQQEECLCSSGLDQYCPFDADPDVAGIGVLLSFIITACLTYAIVLYAYCFRLDDFSAKALTRLDNLASKIILWVFDLLKPIVPRWVSLRRLPLWVDGEMLNRVLMTFSDQQLVTGFALLIVGYAQMQSFTEYHFDIVDSLTTLAFVVHDSSSGIVRAGIMKKNDRVKQWRGGIVVIFMTLTLVTALPMGNQYWLYSYGVPTKCVWSQLGGNYNPRTSRFWNMIITMLLQIWGIASTFDDYFQPQRGDWIFNNSGIDTAQSIVVKVMTFPRDVYLRSVATLDQVSNSQSGVLWARWWRVAWWRAVKMLSYVAAAAVLLFSEILASEAFELQRQWALLLGSIYRIFLLRDQAADEGMEGDESAWGFGQAVPVFLLIIPLSALLESSYEAHCQRKGGMSQTDLSTPRNDSHEPDFFTDAPSTTSPTTSTGHSERQRDSLRGGQPSGVELCDFARPRPHPGRLDTESRGSISYDNQRTEANTTTAVSTSVQSVDPPSHATSGPRRRDTASLRQSTRSVVSTTSSTGRKTAGYYFGWQSENTKTEFEDHLYKNPVFSSCMIVMLLGMFAGWTCFAIYL